MGVHRSPDLKRQLAVRPSPSSGKNRPVDAITQQFVSSCRRRGRSVLSAKKIGRIIYFSEKDKEKLENAVKENLAPIDALIQNSSKMHDGPLEERHIKLLTSLQKGRNDAVFQAIDAAMQSKKSQLQLVQTGASVHLDMSRKVSEQAIGEFKRHAEAVLEVDFKGHSNEVKKMRDMISVAAEKSKQKAEHQVRMIDVWKQEQFAKIEVILKNMDIAFKKGKNQIQLKKEQAEAAHQKRLQENAAKFDKALKLADVEAKRIQNEFQKLADEQKLEINMRNQLTEEWKLANDNYQRDLANAKEVRDQCIRDNSSFRMWHTPPKMDVEAKKVIPGSVTWRRNC